MHTNLTVFEDIHELLSLQTAARKGARRIVEEDLSIIKNAAMIVAEGRILWTGSREQVSPKLISTFGQNPEFVSVGGRTVLPAFIEPHTHLVFAGERSQEFEWRMQGQTYQDISARGGGILATVKATREASFEQLKVLAQERADRFCAQGVTLLEAKTGYGLDQLSEEKCLRVARALNGPDVLTTYLGPHSRSPDFPDLDSYMEQIVSEILPKLAREKLIDRADIYIEKGFYTLPLARKYFLCAQELGLPITAHVEQLSEFGGTDLALEFNAQSVDHVVYISPPTIEKIARSDSTAVLLPVADFYLKMRYPPARELINAGARVALSSDFNPGTSPSQDLSLVGVLARLEMKMTLVEVLAAFTLGAAFALGQNSERGSLEVGKRCDFIALDSGWRELFYSVGHHPVYSVWKAGKLLR